MRKFITLTFAIATFFISTTAIQANTVANTLTNNSFTEVKNKKKVKKTYYQTKYVKQHGRTIEQTYKVTEFYNGTTEFSLIRSRYVRRGFFGRNHTFSNKYGQSRFFNKRNRLSNKRFRTFKRKRTHRYKNRYFINKRF